MSSPAPPEEEDHGKVFLDESDIIDEVPVDEEDLPDADDSDSENVEEDDDSMHIFTGHTGELYAVACSPKDPTLVATGGGDDKGYLWRIGQADWSPLLEGHMNSVGSLDFSTDGQLLASGCLDGFARIWDTSGNLLRKIEEGPGDDGGIEWVRWHPKGHVVLAGAEDCNAWMWNGDTGKYLQTFAGHSGSVRCGDFTPDGKTICTGSADSTVRTWNPRSGECIHVIKLKGQPTKEDEVTCLVISSDSMLVLTGEKDGSVKILNITTGKVVTLLSDSHTDSVECLAFAPSSRWAATGGMDEKLIIWDLQHSVPRFKCHNEGGVTCLAWLGGSRYIAAGCGDGKVRIWDSLGGECVETFKGHSDNVSAISVSANGDYLVSVSVDGTARVFEVEKYR